MNARGEATAGFWSRSAIFLIALLLLAAFLSSQVLIGGTRIIFALPAYGFLCLASILSLPLFRFSKPAPDAFCFWSTLLFFAYIIGRALYSPVPYQARFDIYPILGGLVVYFLTTLVLTEPRWRVSILFVLMVAALAHVAVGAMQFRHGDNFMPLSFLQRFDYGQRASGFYICPNHLAGLLEVLGVFGLSLTCWSRWPAWSKLLTAYLTAMCYLGVILTGSRGGYLSVGASLIVFVFLSARILRAAGSAAKIRIAIAGVLVAVLAGAFAFSIIRKSEFLTSRTRQVADQGDIRIEFWRGAVEQWKLSPIFGTGSRTYQYYGRKFRTERVQMDPVYAHNDYLQLLADYGLVGLATFVPLLVAHLRRGLITARRIGPRRIAASHSIPSNAMALNVGALSALGAYAVHSFFDFNLHIPANLLLMAFVFGLLANSGVGQEPATTTGARSLLVLARALLVLLGLGLGWQAWQLAPGEYYAEQSRTALRDYRPLQAIALAQKGIAKEKENPNLYYYLGRSRILAGDSLPDPVARASFYRAAVPAFAQAHELAPLDKSFSLELAFTYDGLGRFAEAEWLFGEAMAFDPKSGSIRRYYEAHLARWASQGLAPVPKAPLAPTPES